MGNCLVTKLKEVVNNDSLKKVGEMRLGCSFIQDATLEQRTLRMEVSSGTTMEIDILGNGSVGKTEEEMMSGNKHLSNLGGGTTLYFSNGNYEISVTDKYSIIDIYTPSVSSCLYGNIDDLAYTASLRRLSLYRNANTTGDLSALNGKADLYMARLGGTSVTGNIAALENCTNLNEIRFGECQNIEGNISSFGSMAGLMDVDITGSRITGNVESFAGCILLRELQMNTTGQASGDLKTLALAWIAAGRTSGSVVFVVQSCTFDGAPCGGPGRLNWTGPNDITFTH